MIFESARYRKALRFFRFGSELLGKLPSRGDGPLDVLVKLLAMADAAEKVWGGKTHTYTDIFTRYNLLERTSGPFVKMFFGTGVADAFKVNRVGVSEHLELIEAVDGTGERIFFQEWRYGGRPEISDDFFHTPAFDFSAALSALWAKYPTGIYLSVKRGRYEVPSVTFSAVPPSRMVVTTAVAEARIAADVAAHAARAGQPWAYVAYGPPGVGKSQHAVTLAQRTGGRLLKLDATSLPMLGIQDVGFLLAALAPTFLVIDDFDRAPLDDARARVLYLFEHLHAAHASVTVAITVNDSTVLDAALLRSERIDDAIEFVLPDADERRDLLIRLHIATDDIDAVVAATDGWSHADINGLARRATREPLPAVLAAMAKLRALSKASADKATTPGSTKDAAQTGATPKPG